MTTICSPKSRLRDALALALLAAMALTCAAGQQRAPATEPPVADSTATNRVRNRPAGRFTRANDANARTKIGRAHV